jgi:hypothetical protein
MKSVCLTNKRPSSKRNWRSYEKSRRKMKRIGGSFLKLNVRDGDVLILMMTVIVGGAMVV